MSKDPNRRAPQRVEMLDYIFQNLCNIGTFTNFELNEKFFADMKGMLLEQDVVECDGHS